MHGCLWLKQLSSVTLMGPHVLLCSVAKHNTHTGPRKGYLHCIKEMLTDRHVKDNMHCCTACLSFLLSAHVHQKTEKQGLSCLRHNSDDSYWISKAFCLLQSDNPPHIEYNACLHCWHSLQITQNKAIFWKVKILQIKCFITAEFFFHKNQSWKWSCNQSKVQIFRYSASISYPNMDTNLPVMSWLAHVWL